MIKKWHFLHNTIKLYFVIYAIVIVLLIVNIVELAIDVLVILIIIVCGSIIVWENVTITFL